MGRRPGKRVWGAAAAATAALALPVASAAGTAAPRQSLALVSSETLSVVRKAAEDEAHASVFVVNEGSKTTRLAGVTFKGVPSPVEVRAGRATAPGKSPQIDIPAGHAARLTLTFVGLRSLEKKVKGVLVISGGAKPLTRTVEITPTLKPARNWSHDIPLFSLGAAALLAAISLLWVVKEGGLGRLLAPAPGPKWSLDSWATTLTAAGAVLGTTLGSVTLPEVPTQIDKDTLVTLNVFFGLLLVAGPFAFQALRRPSATPLDPSDDGLWSVNGTLLLAACLTFAAAAGEIATLGLLFWEILGGGTWGTVAKWSTVAAEVIALWYFFWTIPRVAAADWPGLQRIADIEAAKADRRRMSEFARILHRELRPRRSAALEEEAVPLDAEVLRALTDQLEDSDPKRREEAHRSLRLMREPTDELVGANAERPAGASKSFRRWTLP